LTCCKQWAQLTGTAAIGICLSCCSAAISSSGFSHCHTSLKKKLKIKIGDPLQDVKKMKRWMGNAVVKFFPTLSSFLETNDNQIMKWYLPYSPQWHYCNSTCSPQVKYVQSSHSLLVWQVMEEQSQQPELFVAAGQEVPKLAAQENTSAKIGLTFYSVSWR
jgi:hypothetical protein